MDFWIIAGLAAFLMGLSKGGVPMIAILAVPLMSLFMDPALAAGLLLPIYIAADMYAVYLFRKAFSVRNLKILLPGAIVGILIGFATVSYVPGDAGKLLVSGIGFYYLASALHNRLSKTPAPPRPADVPRGLFWGTITGLTSYISHAGGPPYQAYVLPQKLDKMVYLGTTTIFFTIVNLMKVPPFIQAGQITWDSAVQAMWLAPFALAGAWSGARISRALPERIFFILIEVALALVSFKLLYEVLTG
ncbi:sulfite exporter TauE/SafE family protein [Marivita sp.]|uniref:sulfite exporter TauE/SafE family protein n=1 Tax=Marivita sp. TaxID=2003365 RepID=UPI00321AFE91